MENELTNLSLTALEKLYRNEIDLLKKSLLDGVSWEALTEQRWRVTQLSILLHKRLSASSDPSSIETRKTG